MSVQLFIDRWFSRFEQAHFEWLLIVTVLLSLAWFSLTIFIYWRRTITNLTPVDAPSANPNAAPDFLGIDHEKRQNALERGDQFAARFDRPDQVDNSLTVRKAIGWTAIAFAGIAIAIAAIGLIAPESVPGGWLGNYFEN